MVAIDKKKYDSTNEGKQEGRCLGKYEITKGVAKKAAGKAK